MNTVCGNAAPRGQGHKLHPVDPISLGLNNIPRNDRPPSHPTEKKSFGSPSRRSFVRGRCGLRGFVRNKVKFCVLGLASNKNRILLRNFQQEPPRIMDDITSILDVRKVVIILI